METSKKSTGEEWSDLPLYAEGTRASLSQSLVLAKVKKIIAICGLGYDKPLASYDLITQSLKMSEGIFPSGERPSLPILPPSGMTRNGALFQQPAWEPIINETECSLWPTPTAVTRPMEGNVRMYRAKIKAGEMTEAEAEAILGKSVWEPQGKVPAMWPTPTVNDSKNASLPPSQTGRGSLVGQLLQSETIGKLNPRWVEWLMGFPDGWTDLEA